MLNVSSLYRNDKWIHGDSFHCIRRASKTTSTTENFFRFSIEISRKTKKMDNRKKRNWTKNFIAATAARWVTMKIMAEPKSVWCSQMCITSRNPDQTISPSPFLASKHISNILSLVHGPSPSSTITNWARHGSAQMNLIYFAKSFSLFVSSLGRRW